MKMIFLALIVQCCINFAFGQAFEITRESHGRDTFNMPASICKGNGAESGSGCKSFDAVDGVRNCSCLCPAKNATFTFYNKRWSCAENRKLRKHLYHGCDLTTSFTVENADRRLPTLAFGGRKKISIWFVFWPFWSCSLDIRSSWFLGCWGSKIFLREHYNAAVRLFTISRRNSNAPYVLKVNNNIPGTNIFRGKIINLVIDCRVTQTTQRVPFDSSCLLFKLEGNTMCPVANTTVTNSSTMHPVETSLIVPSTSRITASHMFTHASVIRQNISSTIMSVTPSHILAIKPTISNATAKASNSHLIVSRVSTYLGTQPIMTSATNQVITEISSTESTSQPAISEVSTYLETQQPVTPKISPTASASELTVSLTELATQPTVTEFSPITSASQPSDVEISPITSATQPTVSEMPPTVSATQPAFSEMSPRASVTQPTVTTISPTTFATQPTVSEMLPRKRVTQPTTSEISSRASNTQTTVSEVSPGLPNTQQPGSEISPTASDALPTISEVLPTESDTQPTASEISPSEPNIPPTVSEILPTEPDTQPTIPETSETSQKEPGTPQSPRILLPKTRDNEPTPLTPNVPPTLSPDREESTDKDSSSVGLIAGIPITLIIIAAIVVCFLYRRRYSNKRPRSSSGTISEVTMDTLVMSPQINRAHSPDHDRASYNTLDSKDPHSLNGSPFEIPEYDVPLSQINRSFEDEDKPCQLYAPPDIVKRKPGNRQEPFYYVLEEPVANKKPPTDHVLEDNGREANENCKNKDPMYYVLEGPYPEGIEGNDQSSAISSEHPEEPVYCTVEDLFRASSRVSCHKPITEVSNSPSDDPKCADEPIYNVLERRYFQGSMVPAHYLQICPNEPIFTSIQKPSSASSNQENVPKDADEPVYDVLERRYFRGSKVPAHYVQLASNGPIFTSSDVPLSDVSKSESRDPKHADEPVGKILEERYLDGSQVPVHYVRISPNGPVFSTLEKLYRNSRKVSNYDPKCGGEPEGNLVEERYLEGSELPEQYVQITPNGPVFNILEKLYRDSVKGSKHDPEHGSESGASIAEERCFEGSEVPKHYVQITPNGPVFSTLKRLHRNSRKGSKYDPKCGKEPEGNIVEERYLEGSELPEQYVQITTNGPVFNILEKLYRDSVKGSKHDPERGSEPGGSIVEERYLEGSEVPKHYVQITPNGPVFSTLKRLHRHSRKGSKYDPKCGSEPEDNIVEERYLEGSELPEQYVQITPNGPVFNILEKLYRDSVKGSKHDPEHGSEPGSSIVEERYLEGSEVPKHYVKITPNGPVFSTLKRLHRHSRKGSKYDPKCGSEPEDNIVEERYLEGSELPEQYVQITPNGPVFNILEKLYRDSVKGSKHNPERGSELEGSIVEERYLEGSEVPKHYVQITPNGPVFSTLKRLHRSSRKGSKYDPKCGSEPEDNIVEERYLEGSELPEQYVQITPNGPVFNILEKLYRDSVKGSKHNPERGSELEGSIVEERYLEGSEVPKHYVQITPNGPVFSTLKRLHRSSRKGSKYDPKCGSEPEDNIVEERYLEGSELPEQYVQITPNGPVFNILEKLYRDSVKGSKHDPERDSEPGGSIVEERYLEGSEVPKHYVQITLDGPVFSTLKRLHRSSRKGSKYDPKRGNESEGNIVEERYLEGSEVPEHYEPITPNDPVFNILEKLYRDSVKGSKHDPERGNEAVDKILEQRYLEGSEVPERYVQITPNGPVFNILEKLYRNSRKGSKYDPKCGRTPEGDIAEDGSKETTC